MSRKFLQVVLSGAILVWSGRFAHAQEMPYFVAYSHHLEDAGDLEVAVKSASGQPGPSDRFYGEELEFEYGTRAWWTTEIYLDVQSTENESTIFTGFRLENRFRLLMKEHVVNPVLYAEFEDVNAADKGLLEVVGHDGVPDLLEDNAVARKDKQRELELKLILSSDVKGWNIAENFISEKNLTIAPWEFGYALAASRPLAFRARARACRFCAEKIRVGAEMYGGLGDTDSLGTRDTSHYVAPVAGWSLPRGFSLTGSVGFGLNEYSLSRVYRVGLSYEIEDVGRRSDAR
ncbi:MAG: hypothetical protein ACP5M4_02430 [Acidobacteriaceae bacterium]